MASALPPATSSIQERSKRATKACHRCRIKKSKVLVNLIQVVLWRLIRFQCEGPSPCGRCRTDNVICVFDRRRRPDNRVYPKGYVELLEHQQTQLLRALKKLYQQAHDNRAGFYPRLKWSGSDLPAVNSILEDLGVFEDDDSAKPGIEEDSNASHLAATAPIELTRGQLSTNPLVIGPASLQHCSAAESSFVKTCSFSPPLCAPLSSTLCPRGTPSTSPTDLSHNTCDQFDYELSRIYPNSNSATSCIDPFDPSTPISMMSLPINYMDAC
ncbi:uncharacterized protein PV06_01523 [Exophiala oligosperma]|uniref:Zn(2)-C6 fungal-type domain-containing protein n=1 Tax=Exophiala oligosperma TaxID=215243 RepID=A0A0D2C7M4_9EURO|nr:uncharacterized protein PV06_01523 [Exophiala oligosperma]KIW45812.1 hypothetical protein PV06_01523 [Exophiala oligosperma]